MSSQEPSGSQRPLHVRLLWFAALWLGGVAAIGAVAFLLRRLIL